MSDVLAWTEEGAAALVEERGRGVPLCVALDRPALIARIGSAVSRFGPAWQRGVKRADAFGQATAAHVASAWGPDLVPAQLTIDQAAGVGSLIGSRSDDQVGPFTELVVRDHGDAFAIAMLIRMWSLVTNYHDPDYPKEGRLSIWVHEIDLASSSLGDCSVSHAKGKVALYLQKRHAAGDPPARAALEAAVTAAWEGAPIHARPALAIACNDHARATQLTRELLTLPTRTWHPHFAWDALPYLISDPTLLDAIGFTRHGRLTLRFLAHLGPDALPFYEQRFATRIAKHEKLGLVAQLVNLRGPRTARLLAPLAEKPPFAAAVRGYFGRYPELLAEVRDDREFAVHAEALAKLDAKLTKPAARTGARRKK